MGVKNTGRLGTLALTALLVACSGPAETADTADATTTTAAPGTTATSTPEGRPSSFQEVQASVIQIVAQGTFRDPELGFSDGSGLGSGFIISPDGLAVTNNHVVAGAATLEVFVGGETDTSYNASIVGVSECNDLALIDIVESEPFQYLDWYEGEISPGSGRLCGRVPARRPRVHPHRRHCLQGAGRG